jgi:hypothetical protein
MNEAAAFLGHLSLAEFLVVWTSVIVVVSFYFLLLRYLIQIEKDLNLVIRNVKRISRSQRSQ